MDWYSGGELPQVGGNIVPADIGAFDHSSGGEYALLAWLISTGLDVTAALGLHQDALYGWMLRNASTFASREVVGALNELNSTSGIEYWEARQTFLGL